MEFLQTPDVTHLARAAADSNSVSASPNHQPSPAPHAALTGIPTHNLSNAATNQSNNVTAPAPPMSVPWTNFMTPSLIRPAGTNKIPDGSRQDIKNSFRSLFSPAPGASPSPFLAGSYPYYPGITPYIAPNQSPVMEDMSHGIDTDARKKDDDVDAAALMSTPHLRKAAKEAAAKEFMNMQTLPNMTVTEQNTSPSSGATSVEQTVPSNDRRNKKNAEQATSIGSAGKTGAQAESKSTDGKPESVFGPAATGKNGTQMPHFIPMYPMGMRGFPPQASGMAGMTGMPPVGYPYPFMFPAHAAQMMNGGYMQQPQPIPQKEAVKVNESPEEKKARIEREKEELIREFKKKTREAALVRFRQKRRERKFGKLIRYNCRKKLADARPRIKGRFVRVKDIEKVKTSKEDDSQIVPSVR